MGTTVRLTPLLGVEEEAPLCYLLEIGSYTLLLDCGWDEACTESLLESVKRVLPRIDGILLSHPSPSHLGALPHLAASGSLTAPIYSTKPVKRMGEVFAYETYMAKQAASEFSGYSLEAVDQAFRLNPRWTELRYGQWLALPPKGAAQDARPSSGGAAPGSKSGGGGAPQPAALLSICPQPAGRYLGGSIWRILVNSCGREVVYAVDYNHKKERLLNATTFHELLGAGSQPALLISDAVNALAQQLPDKQRREEELLGAIQRTVGGQGNVLIPVDAAGRVLELALLLDDHFARARISATPVLLSGTVRTLLEYGRSQLEYMSSDMEQAFSLSRRVPLTFQKLVTATRLEDLAKIPGPKVVLATLPSLEAGPARQLLVEWAEDPRNTVVFVERAQQGTLAAALQCHVPGPEPLLLRLSLGRRVPLEGDELATWQAEKAAAEEAEAEAAAARVSSAGPLFGLLPSKPSASAAGLPPGTPATADPRHQALRASSGSISKLVRDAATGAVVQQLGGAGLLAARGGGFDDSILMDGFEPPQGSVAPTLPNEDEWLEEEQWDEYGAKLGENEFKVRADTSLWGRQPAGAGVGGAEAMDVDGGGAGAEGGAGSVADEIVEAPTKLVVREVEVPLRAALRFFDFEGRADGRAMHDYLARVAPQRLVLVRGSADARAHLAAELGKVLVDYGTLVNTPGIGEAVELELAPSQMVVLGDALATAVQPRPVGQYGVAWLQGMLAGPEAGVQGGLLELQPLPPSQRPALALLGSGDNEDAEARPMDGAEQGGVLLAQAGSLPTLSRLKLALAGLGIESVFLRRGVLAVPLPGAGEEEEEYLCVTMGGGAGVGADQARVQLQGPIGETYYRVRDVIYSQFGVC